MKSLTAKTMLLIASLIVSARISGQSVASTHPIQIGLIQTFTDSINKSVNTQINQKVEIAKALDPTAAEFLVMKTWEDKYNSYLKNVNGYAKALKGGMTLYVEGVKALNNVTQLKKAIAHNKEGIVASALENNLYIEVAAELLKSYRIMNMCIAKGGSDNMLTGAERTELLWMLNDSLHQLNKKLERLTFSILCYNLGDVWRNATIGITRCDHGSIARNCQRHWINNAKAVKAMAN